MPGIQSNHYQVLVESVLRSPHKNEFDRPGIPSVFLLPLISFFLSRPFLLQALQLQLLKLHFLFTKFLVNPVLFFLSICLSFCLSFPSHAMSTPSLSTATPSSRLPRSSVSTGIPSTPPDPQNPVANKHSFPISQHQRAFITGYFQTACYT